MAAKTVREIRNVTLIGDAGAGKTTLAEAMLFKAGLTNRLGSVDEGTSVLDYDEESRERKRSTQSSVTYFEHNDTLINLVDTPGTPDYAGQAFAALIAADTVVLVVSAVSGVHANARRLFRMAGEYGLARAIVINHCQAENIDLAETFNVVRESFGVECHPVNLPAGGATAVADVLKHTSGESDIFEVAGKHTELIDAIVETDERLMEGYMETGTISYDKLAPAIGQAVVSGHVIPVFFTDAKHDMGVTELLDGIIDTMADPGQAHPHTLEIGEGDAHEEHPIEVDPDGEFLAVVFKVTSDPKSNIRYTCARILSGAVTADDTMAIGDQKPHRIGHLFKLRGADHIEVERAIAGDIIAFAKLELHIGDILRTKPGEGKLTLPRFPKPMFALAAEPKSRGDADKITTVLRRFVDEDPCFEYHRDDQTHELVMTGLGDEHLHLIRSKMKRYFKLEIETHPPKVPYLETIAGSAKGIEYTHKKQSGGSGQFAKVVIDIEPLPRGEGYEFEDKIYGGAIDLAYRPSVDKGIRAQMALGVVAGFPVVDVKVTLVDGKTHPVDSKDVAFQTAGRQAFKKAIAQAKPVLLEPMVNLEVTIPADSVGEISRDISGKRGQVVGQDQLPGNQMVIHATVPLAEVANYSSQLKSATAGQGSYMMELSHYEPVPGNVQQQIVASYTATDDDE